MHPSLAAPKVCRDLSLFHSSDGGQPLETTGANTSHGAANTSHGVLAVCYKVGHMIAMMMMMPQPCCGMFS
ncbi:unnamed protein product [Merluccius merluccius]